MLSPSIISPSASSDVRSPATQTAEEEGEGEDSTTTSTPPTQDMHGDDINDKQTATSTGISSMTNSSERRQSEFIASSKDSKTAGDEDFNILFRQAQEAIKLGVQPDLIQEGSSGSYFVKDPNGRTIAVFKPKDEEPFAPLNPKWPKFFQRVVCFCCFGRACLIPNAGYLSETGASVIDQRLGLKVVPKTRVVKLASPSFFYERRFCCYSEGSKKHKPKEGSFQTFVHGYEPADHVIARWKYDPTLLTPDESERFVYLFQKMVVLDYIIRNTDRHMDNWLIKHVPGSVLELAAIDNGLAFPVKHPEIASRIRQFPFKWSTLEWAQMPWDKKLRKELLKKLSPSFVHETCKEIKNLFRHDIAANRLLVTNQLRVMRGQLWNLRLALEHNLTPADMAKLEPLIVKKKYRRNPPPPGEIPGNWAPYFREKSAWHYAGSCYCCSSYSTPCGSNSSGRNQPASTKLGPAVITDQPTASESDKPHPALEGPHRPLHTSVGHTPKPK